MNDTSTLAISIFLLLCSAAYVVTLYYMISSEDPTKLTKEYTGILKRIDFLELKYEAKVRAKVHPRELNDIVCEIRQLEKKRKELVEYRIG